MEQAELFVALTPAQRTDTQAVALFALGEFQARKKVLAERPLALDRLRGAFRRAAEFYHCDELTDEQIVGALRALGIQVLRVPSFVAKHPFRVKVDAVVAARASEFYDDLQSSSADAIT